MLEAWLTMVPEEAAILFVNESRRLAALHPRDGATTVHRSAAGHMCLA